MEHKDPSEMSAEELVAWFKALDEIEEPKVDEDGFFDLDTISDSYVGAIDNLLITANGNPDYCRFQRIFEPHGFKYYAGETDSCGWVTGVFETPKGRKILI